MPPYVQPGNPSRVIQQAVAGLPAYLWGSLARTVAPTRMYVTSVALAGSTATIGVTVIEGNLPVVNQLVTITGALPAYFNVTNAKITAVSFTNTPENGVGTIQFSLTNSNIGTTPSPGLAVAPQIEVGEALVAGASSPLALQANTGPDNGQTIRADVSFPTMPGAAVVDLQGAAIDVDSEYQFIVNVSTIAGGLPTTTQGVIIAGVRANFLRFNNSGIVGGGSSKIVGKILV